MTGIKVFCCFYNEAPIIPYFLSHYHYADQIEAIVSRSIDATRELLAADPRVILRDREMPDGIDDDLKITWLNQAISQPDKVHGWQIVVDADELVWPPDDPAAETVRAYLDSVPRQDVALLARMVNVFRTVEDADLDPTRRPVALQRRHGIAGTDGMNRGYQKPSVVRANVGIHYAVGQHWLSPRRQYSSKIFHGAHWQNADPSWAITRRVRDRKERMSKNNLRKNYGGQHHTATADDVRRELEAHAHDGLVL